MNLSRIESPIAITADPLFVFIIIGAFTTVISFQVGFQIQDVISTLFNTDGNSEQVVDPWYKGGFGFFRGNTTMLIIYAWTLNLSFLIIFGMSLSAWFLAEQIKMYIFHGLHDIMVSYNPDRISLGQFQQVKKHFVNPSSVTIDVFCPTRNRCNNDT